MCSTALSPRRAFIESAARVIPKGGETTKEPKPPLGIPDRDSPKVDPNRTRKIRVNTCSNFQSVQRFEYPGI
ncbi:hypothetical protein L1887_28711 [Cichorium endivia]|nr:hypothetical protein L1887_28711 [Cichorium endivia]